MSLDRIRSDWSTLGAQDPLWAVLAEPATRHGRWDPTSFLATGEREIAQVLARADSVRMDPGAGVGRGDALDFGCGAGRLTIALAAHFDTAVGVDISPTMLAKARELDTEGRCRFIENDRSDLSVFGDASFDLVVSALVLQHLPRSLAADYLAELVRVLRPGGVLTVQLADRPDVSLRGVLVRLLPLRVVRLLQRRLLGFPAPMDMHPMRREELESIVGQCGARIADTSDDPLSGGGNWRYVSYWIVRD